MKVDSLYPFWSDVHDELLALLEWLPDAAWDYRPKDCDVRSIRQMALHLIDRERYWMVHIAQSGPWHRPLMPEFKTSELMIEGLIATRNQTKLYIESLQPETLRVVRTVPADVDGNEQTTNRPISWLIWQVVHHEIYHWGQIESRRYEALERR